jgi:hypothetical protein
MSIFFKKIYILKGQKLLWPIFIFKPFQYPFSLIPLSLENTKIVSPLAEEDIKLSVVGFLGK